MPPKLVNNQDLFFKSILKRLKDFKTKFSNIQTSYETAYNTKPRDDIVKLINANSIVKAGQSRSDM